MTRKHFVALADVIREAKLNQTAPEQMRIDIARGVADVCRRENPAFNTTRFLEACDVQ